MRFLTLSTIIAMFSVFCVVVSTAKAEEVKNGYFLIEEPFANVYEQLDPMSPLIRQVKKGEYLELVYDGESWHKVKVDGKVGWIEKRAGKIVESAGGVGAGTIVFLIIILAGVAGAVYYLIQKGSKPLVVKAEDDL